MLHPCRIALAIVCISLPLFPKQDSGDFCGTTRENSRERVFLHRQSTRARMGMRMAVAPSRPSTVGDFGDIAVIDDSDGVVARLNQFNLDGVTLLFTPSAAGASQYRYSVAAGGFDSSAGASGKPLSLGDDDSAPVSLLFRFPFFGAQYDKVYVNSDGNLTFTAGDSASSERSLGRLTSGAPRIAPLLEDLDPSASGGGVRVLSEPGRLVVTWNGVREYAASGTGAQRTFQLKLYLDGRIEFSYSGVASSTSAVVGIAPGHLNGSTALVDFLNDASRQYSAALAERFASGLAIDMITAAQRFFATHDDAYDYLVVYNDMGISAMGGGTTIAYEQTVRSTGTGYGDEPQDDGALYGSVSRLQAVLNMGPLSQYPTDPLGPVSGRPGDTPLSILAHETGHLFLAYASVPDSNSPSSKPMIGYGGSHWSFLFNSDASFLEGEEIIDNGSGGFPTRFYTNKIVKHYSAIDQYLMGLRAPGDAPNSFVVQNSDPSQSPTRHPAAAVYFNGDRMDVAMDKLVQAMGRRTPDYTVAQRRFRLGFILIVAQGTQPSAAALAQLGAYRSQFEQYFAAATDSNATAETTIKRSVKLSLYPAAGLVTGSQGTATVTLQQAPASDMAITLAAPKGRAVVPAQVTVKAGSLTASLQVQGLAAGVEEITATPSDAAYETAFARVQVADASGVKMTLVSGANQQALTSGPLPAPIVIRLTDANNLNYVGARVTATASSGGSAAPFVIATDSQGNASFTWTPGAGSLNQLTLALESAPAVSVTVSAGSAVPVINSVQSAASGSTGITLGSLAAVAGVNRAGGKTALTFTQWQTAFQGLQVLLNGAAMQLFYVSDTRIGFYVPSDAQYVPVVDPTGAISGLATLTVVTPSGATATASVPVASAVPAIFDGGVLLAGTPQSAQSTPAQSGGFIEIYCTGMGPVVARNGLEWTVNTPRVYVGGVEAEVWYSGHAPGYVGLYQVNARIPAALTAGSLPLVLNQSGKYSNIVYILVR
jgi:uncharacterized protein (TIGR03437 family)